MHLPIRRNLLAWVVLLFTLAVPGVLSAQRVVTFDDIMALRAVGTPIVSPDGELIVYTVRQWEPAGQRSGGDASGRMEARTHLWRVPASGGEARQLTFGEKSATSPAWSPDGVHVSFVSARDAGEDARPQIWVMRADGGEAWKLTDAKEGVTTYAWAPDSSRIAFVSRDPLSKEAEEKRKRRDDAQVFESDFRQSHLWVIDLASREAKRLTGGDEFTVSGEPAWSPDSRQIAYVVTPTPLLRDGRQDIEVVSAAGSDRRRITDAPGSERFPAWSPDGRTLAYVAVPNAEPPLPDGTHPSPVALGRLMFYRVETGTTEGAGPFEFTPGAPTWSANGRRLYFTAGRGVYREIFAYDVSSRRYTALTDGAMATLGSFTRDGSRAALLLESASAPADVYLADTTFKAPVRLTTANPQASELALGQAEVVTWTTDGHQIEGVLLKPVGYQSGRRYPLLLVVHGGPASAHYNSFRMTPGDGGQHWAGQGWAVLYPNPRGSTNYGEPFMRANIRDLGGGDYRDIMGGVDAMIARGVADPERLAVMGWSYGGYMTSWIVSQTTRFKAAMNGAGLTNMVSMHGTNDIPNTTWAYFGGYPNEDTKDLYVSRSGITYADRITTPVLILHGSGDERVPIGQPMELYRALKDRGRTVELVFYPRAGHGLTEYYHQLDRLKRQYDWITRYTLGEDGRKTTTQ